MTEFVARMDVKTGDPLHSATKLGPLCTVAARDTIHRQASSFSN